MRLGTREWLRLLVPAGLLVLFGVFALVAYRWIGSVGEVNRVRLQEQVQARATELADEFDGEISRAYFTFLLARPVDDPVRTLADNYARWLATSPARRLIRDVFLIRAGQTGAEWARLVPGKGTEPCGQPAEFRDWSARLKASVEASTPPQAGRSSLLIGEIPAFFVPVMMMHAADASKPTLRFEAAYAGFLLVWLDRDYLEKQFLPAVVARHFGAGTAFDYHVAVIAPRENSRVVYVSDRRLGPRVFDKPDARATLLQVRIEEMAKALVPDGSGAAFPYRSVANAGEWELRVVHRAGSLDRALANTRRGLAVGLGSALLLAMSLVVAVGFIIVSSRRAERLARQQLAFVAGVSHELRTPLSVIRTAGENLADGVTTDPADVRRYGALVAAEGRHLTEMVEQVMAFAGFEAGRQLSERAEVDLGEVIEAAVAGCRELESNALTVERQVAPDLPPVQANAAALTRALGNLLSNAAKYAAAGRWVRVGAEAAPPPDGVRITVEDRGPGIPPDEQRRIFEPFYRGRDVTASRTRGSGLGLSLVRRIMEAHGGRVSVRSRPGEGTTFTLHLPSDSPPRARAVAPDAGRPATARPGTPGDA